MPTREGGHKVKVGALCPSTFKIALAPMGVYILSYRLGSLNCIETFADDDDDYVRLCNLGGLVNNYHKREIKMKRLVVGPLLVGSRPGSRALYLLLNPARSLNIW